MILGNERRAGSTLTMPQITFKNLLFLARLGFLCKAGCVLHYLQYKRGLSSYFRTTLGPEILNCQKSRRTVLEEMAVSRYTLGSDKRASLTGET